MSSPLAYIWVSFIQGVTYSSIPPQQKGKFCVFMPRVHITVKSRPKCRQRVLVKIAIFVLQNSAPRSSRLLEEGGLLFELGLPDLFLLRLLLLLLLLIDNFLHEFVLLRLLVDLWGRGKNKTKSVDNSFPQGEGGLLCPAMLVELAKIS